MAIENRSEPVRPATVLLRMQDGTEIKFTSETYNDLIWLYNHFRTQKSGPWRELHLLDASGVPLKLRLVIRSELVLSSKEDEVIFEDLTAEEIFEKGWIEV